MDLMAKRSHTTILENEDVQPADAIIELPEISGRTLDTIYTVDDETAMKFAARYGLISNTQACDEANCPNDRWDR